MKTHLPTPKFLAVALLLSSGLAFAAGTISGPLMFTLKTAGEPISAANLEEASEYADFEKEFELAINDGRRALQLIRSFDASIAEQDNRGLFQTSRALEHAIDTVMDPNHKYSDRLEAWKAPENGWAKFLYQYSEGEPDDDMPTFKKVNDALRDKEPDSPEITEWVNSMRQALWHVPRFEGISFRGALLTPAQIETYYALGKLVDDPAFISTSLLPHIALGFASKVSGDPSTADKVALVMVIKGVTGRALANFTIFHRHEAEILFANGSKFKVEAKSPFFQDATLGKTQVLWLKEVIKE